MHAVAALRRSSGAEAEQRRLTALRLRVVTNGSSQPRVVISLPPRTNRIGMDGGPGSGQPQQHSRRRVESLGSVP